jgi:CHAD domain-containing protein
MALLPSGKWIDILPDDSVCHAARLSLEARLMATAYHLPRAAYHFEQDVEHVHRLRVSTRRAAAALKLYREVLPRKRARWIKKQLKKVRRAAGEARDLDVLAERFRADYGEYATRLVARIVGERQATQPAIVQIAERFRSKEKFIRLTADLLEAIDCSDKHGKSNDHECFGNWAKRQLADASQRFLAAIPDEHAEMAALHQFRIRAKALRYSIELLASAFGSALRQVHYRNVEELQERLGRINDHVTASDRLRDWATKTEDAELQDLLCQFAEEEVVQLTTELGAWHEWWTGDRIEELRQGLAHCE